MSIRQYWFVLWELTKRELKRKYARSFLGILWSCVYPLMRMALVVVLFSTIFNKGIDKYPAYYFVGFLMFEFLRRRHRRRFITLKDNRNLLIKSKLPRELFVLSRVLTAFVNFLLGCIPFALVLACYRTPITINYYMIPVVLLLLLILQPEFPMRYRSGLCFSVMQETFILILFLFCDFCRNVLFN